MDEILLDGDGAIAGRLAAFAANKLLTGRKVVILNSEKTVISGNRRVIASRYKAKRNIQNKADPDKSPKTPRRPDLLLKRIIYGMLPTSRRNCRSDAMKNLRCFLGVPAEFEGKQAEKPVKTVEELHRDSVTLLKLARTLGWNK